VLRAVLSRIDYEGKDPAQLGEVDGQIVFDAASFRERKFPE
jgi:hypothetical protein